MAGKWWAGRVDETISAIQNRRYKIIELLVTVCPSEIVVFYMTRLTVIITITVTVAIKLYSASTKTTMRYSVIKSEK